VLAYTVVRLIETTSAGGVLAISAPLVEGQLVDDRGETWIAERIDGARHRRSLRCAAPSSAPPAAAGPSRFRRRGSINPALLFPGISESRADAEMALGLSVCDDQPAPERLRLLAAGKPSQDPACLTINDDEWLQRARLRAEHKPWWILACGDASMFVIHDEAGLSQGHGLRGIGRLAAGGGWGVCGDAPVIHPAARGGPECRAELGGSIKWAAVLV
jgi:hypothetical protein